MRSMNNKKRFKIIYNKYKINKQQMKITKSYIKNKLIQSQNHKSISPTTF